MRVLVNTPAPQGSTGITTNVFPSMTLGCGAVAGNITSDNVGPLHLINIKRLAYVARKRKRRLKCRSNMATRRRNGRRRTRRSAPLDANRGGGGGALSGGARQSEPAKPRRRFHQPAAAAARAEPAEDHRAAGAGGTARGAAREAQPPPQPVDFVCEADVRAAIAGKRKIYVGPRTIVTPSARDLAGAADVLAPVKG